MEHNALEVHAVTKSYGIQKVLKDVSLTVAQGQIFGLLGPNGAGKTSLLKIILNLTMADSGTVNIFNINSNDSSSREKIAYLPEKFSFYDDQKVLEFLKLLSELRRVPQREHKVSIMSYLEKLNASHLSSKTPKKLSKGELQRVGLSSLLIGNREFLFLDEPFSGLDPIGIREMKDLLLELKNQNKTIFLNTHILSEAQEICTHFAILSKGQSLYQGSMKDLPPGMTLESFFIKTVKEME